ncbi:hypothetical protein Bca4012_010568 [Brassica carinata]
MIEPLVKLLKEQEDALDFMTALPSIATIIVFIVSSFPYNKHIRDWQLSEFKVAASGHKTLLCVFLFLCGAITRNDSCAQHETEPVDVVLRFLTKTFWGIISYVLLFKICVILRSKPLESTGKTKTDEQ